MVVSDGRHLIEKIEFIRFESDVEQLLANRRQYENPAKGAGDRVEQALSNLRMCSGNNKPCKEVEPDGKDEELIALRRQLVVKYVTGLPEDTSESIAAAAEAEVAAREAAVIQRGKEVRQKAAQSKERGKQNEDIDSGK